MPIAHCIIVRYRGKARNSGRPSWHTSCPNAPLRLWLAPSGCYLCAWDQSKGTQDGRDAQTCWLPAPVGKTNYSTTVAAFFASHRSLQCFTVHPLHVSSEKLVVIIILAESVNHSTVFFSYKKLAIFCLGLSEFVKIFYFGYCSTFVCIW